MGGGSGSRFLPLQEKILAKVLGLPVFQFSTYNFFSLIPDWESVLVVCPSSMQKNISSFVGQNFSSIHPKIHFFPPGQSRFYSVWNAISNLSSSTADQIWIHDLARPCISVEDICSLRDLSQIHLHVPLIPGKAVTDSLKKISSPFSVDSHIAKIQTSLNRQEFVRVSTPQIFPLPMLQSAYSANLQSTQNFTDDEQVFSTHFPQNQSTVFFCKNPNPKLTFPADLVTIAGFLKNHTIFK